MPPHFFLSLFSAVAGLFCITAPRLAVPRSAAGVLTRCVLPLLAASWVALSSGRAEARIGGISGLGCSGCHASNQPDPELSLDLPSNIQPGDRIALRLTIRAPDIKAGGFFLRTESGEGAFEAGQGSKLTGSGLTHSIRKAAENGAVTFDFWWTAPAQPNATRFQVSAIASDANGARSGDRAGDLYRDVAYGCTGVELYRDWDQDNFGRPDFSQLKCGQPTGFAVLGTDCNDNDALVFPGASERCNQRDDNCNQQIDEGTEQFVFYLDADGDGYGVPGMSQELTGCAIRPGLAPNNTDCNDSAKLVHPEALELCNSGDDNCDGDADEGLLVSCGLGECARTTESCFDRDCVPGLPAPETCNGLDDDCNGFIDDGSVLCPSGQVCGMTECIADPNEMTGLGGAPGNSGGAGGSASGASGGGSSGGGSSGSAPDDDGMKPAPDKPTKENPDEAPDASAPPSEGGTGGDGDTGGKENVQNSGKNGSSGGGCSVRPAAPGATPGFGWGFVLVVAIAWRRRLGAWVLSLRPLCTLVSVLSCLGSLGCAAKEIKNRPAPADCKPEDPGCPSEMNMSKDGSTDTPPNVTDAGAPVVLPGSKDAGPGARDAAVPEVPCVDACDPNAVGTCLDGRVRSCWKVPGLCAAWNESDCRLGRCADDVSCAQCNDTCDKAGAVGCRNGEMGQCVRDADQCLTWQAESSCASGFCADTAACGTCQHECELDAASECASGSVRQCYQDNNGCRKWSAPSPCALEYCANATSCPAGWALGQRGGLADDRFVAVAVDPAASIAAVGAFYDFADIAAEAGTTDAYLNVKDAADRTTVTERWGSAKNDEAVDVGSIAVGDYYVAGWAEGPIGKTKHQGGRDGFVTRFKKEGDSSKIAWTRLWGSNQHDVPRALSVGKNGDVVVFGSTQGVLPGGSPAGGQDLMLGRWDAVGNQLWLKQWGTNTDDVGTDVVVAPDGAIFVVGRTAGTLGGVTGSGGSDAFLQKLDPSGAVLFTKLWGGSSGDAAESIVMLADGELLVVGTTQGALSGQSKGGIDLHLSRWRQNGEQVWIQQWGTTSDDRVYDLAVDAKERVYAAAAIRNGEPNCPLGQAWLVVWDAMGAPLHENLWDTCENEEFHAVAVDPSGRVALAGFTRGVFVSESRGGADAILVTYNPPPL